MALEFLRGLLHSLTPASASRPSTLELQCNAHVAATARGVFSAYQIPEDSAYPLDIRIQFKTRVVTEEFSIQLYPENRELASLYQVGTPEGTLNIYNLSKKINELIKDLKEINKKIAPYLNGTKENQEFPDVGAQGLYQSLFAEIIEARDKTKEITNFVSSEQQLDFLREIKGTIQKFLAETLLPQLKSWLPCYPCSLLIVRLQINPDFNKKITAQFNKVEANYRKLAASLGYTPCYLMIPDVFE